MSNRKYTATEVSIQQQCVDRTIQQTERDIDRNIFSALTGATCSAKIVVDPVTSEEPFIDIEAEVVSDPVKQLAEKNV